LETYSAADLPFRQAGLRRIIPSAIGGIVQPSISDVEKLIPLIFPLWKELMDFIVSGYPDVVEEWCHSGKNYGWSFRIRSKKRVVMYFTPLEDSFRVAFTLGQAATDAVLSHPDVSFEWKK
jgi:hypothetical protein